MQNEKLILLAYSSIGEPLALRYVAELQIPAALANVARDDGNCSSATFGVPDISYAWDTVLLIQDLAWVKTPFIIQHY